MPAIEVSSLQKSFGEIEAVRGVSFEVAAGEVFGFLGPNGAGKTTTINMLCTLATPSAGSARVAGYDVVRDRDDVRRHIGLVFQDPTLDGYMTAEQNLRLHAELYGVQSALVPARMEQVLRMVGLWERKDGGVMTFSGGMRRRLEIARGLVHRPRIFFLDEPTTGLDPVSRVAVWEMITSLKQQRNLTVLITTHYMDEADRLCDRIAIVDHGKLVALDTPRNLKNSIPGSSVIEAQFLQPPAEWQKTLEGLEGVKSVQPEGADMYRILTEDGSRTTTVLVEKAVHSSVVVKTLTVQSTTLDDVFVHFTGRQLRDQIVDSPLYQSPVAWGK